MKRSPEPNEPSALRGKAPRKADAFPAGRALLALLLSVLQLASAFHFALIPHSFSAAAGGIVHLHGRVAQNARVTAPSAASQAQLTPSDELACVVDACPFADAAHGGLPSLALGISGAASLGQACLLGRARARSAPADLFSRAPKTSPPA